MPHMFIMKINMWNMKVKKVAQGATKKKKKKNITDMRKELPPISEGPAELARASGAGKELRKLALTRG
jgi:hypothetical protein